MTPLQNITHLSTLHAAAHTLSEHWHAGGSVDLIESKAFVKLINDMPIEIKADHSEIQGVLEQAHNNDDWDSDDVANWAQIIIDLTESVDKVYDYRADGDHWEVFSLDATGSDEWKATTETEALATKLVLVLS
jgi:hypothetical protein